ncbi:hypothetical protein [Corynebacterium sp. HMSC08D02]|uniref:hypothetical protein n=1 Tax=Corynebacterium sp. HMSC08D02 TaxID=1581138 RepID=UPI00143A35A1|nr:hypothetical protein [Corynebacterium sp. HMSC08D02]
MATASRLVRTTMLRNIDGFKNRWNERLGALHFETTSQPDTGKTVVCKKIGRISMRK